MPSVPEADSRQCAQPFVCQHEKVPHLGRAPSVVQLPSFWTMFISLSSMVQCRVVMTFVLFWYEPSTARLDDCAGPTDTPGDPRQDDMMYTLDPVAK